MDKSTNADFAARALPLVPLSFSRGSLEESRQRPADFYRESYFRTRLPIEEYLARFAQSASSPDQP